MKLSVLERVLLSNILPVKGSFMNLKLLRVAREDLSFSDKENKLLNLRQEKNQVLWNEPKPPLVKNIEFGEVATEMIKKALIDLDKKEDLSADLLTIYEKFIT
ncbi:MAG: hypothetical protein H8D87_04805 [Deltaproteobacteria bacterium]|nr:hypothetical protein [Candidatus Desulfobacula maris]